MKIAVIGAGYVGLVTGACLAKLGTDVSLVDVDDGKVLSIKKRHCPIYEPGLPELLRSQRVRATAKVEDAVPGADIVFICVGAATSPGDWSVDLSRVEQAAATLASLVENGQTVVVKSTVPPGTTENLVKPLLEKHG